MGKRGINNTYNLTLNWFGERLIIYVSNLVTCVQGGRTIEPRVTQLAEFFATFLKFFSNKKHKMVNY